MKQRLYHDNIKPDALADYLVLISAMAYTESCRVAFGED